MQMNKKIIIKSGFWCVLFIAVLIFLDQYTKHLATDKLMGKDAVDLISGVLQFTFVGNKGIAWGMLWDKINFVVILTTIISILLLFLIFKIDLRINFYIENNVEKLSSKIKTLKVLQIIFLVMFSGAVGNLIDRIRIGYVIDFIYIKLINFPVFNVADIFVTLSMVALIILCLFRIDENEIYDLFKPASKWSIEK